MEFIYFCAILFGIVIGSVFIILCSISRKLSRIDNGLWLLNTTLGDMNQRLIFLDDILLHEKAAIPFKREYYKSEQPI